MRRGKRFSFAVELVALAALVAALAGCSSGADTTDGAGNTTEPAETAVIITISAAASLTDALDEVTAAYTAVNPNITFSINYGASGTLQEQISQGAEADIFFSASKKYMDALEDDGLVVDGTRGNVLGNELVVVVPKDSTLTVSSLADLAGDDFTIVALGDPEAVPAGKYAEQSLASVGVDAAVLAKAVRGSDVKGVLTYVETGDAEAGIVYATDALASDAVKVAFTIPSDAHDPIVYPAAVLNMGASQEAARAFLDYLRSDEAMAIFGSYGFTAAQ